MVVSFLSKTDGSCLAHGSLLKHKDVELVLKTKPQGWSKVVAPQNQSSQEVVHMVKPDSRRQILWAGPREPTLWLYGWIRGLSGLCELFQTPKNQMVEAQSQYKQQVVHPYGWTRGPTKAVPAQAASGESNSHTLAALSLLSFLVASHRSVYHSRKNTFMHPSFRQKSPAEVSQSYISFTCDSLSTYSEENLWYICDSYFPTKAVKK